MSQIDLVLSEIRATVAAGEHPTIPGLARSTGLTQLGVERVLRRLHERGDLRIVQIPSGRALEITEGNVSYPARFHLGREVSG